jgi:hypothetical protein
LIDGDVGTENVELADIHALLRAKGEGARIGDREAGRVFV